MNGSRFTPGGWSTPTSEREQQVAEQARAVTVAYFDIQSLDEVPDWRRRLEDTRVGLPPEMPIPAPTAGHHRWIGRSSTRLIRHEEDLWDVLVTLMDGAREQTVLVTLRESPLEFSLFEMPLFVP